jgi:glycine cleavage system H protein
MTLYFTKDHEWVSVDGTTGTVGVTEYAQGQLGDVVFVEVPAAGTAVAKGSAAAVVESVKAASDVYSPVSGAVTEANVALEAEPALVNTDPENGGWFFKLTLSAPDELAGLMDEAAYKTFVASL